MSIGDVLKKKFGVLQQELERTDASPSEKALHIADMTSYALGLTPHVRVTRRFIFEITTPPTIMRGLRDLVVRRGTERDVGALASIDDTRPELVLDRLARGELVYVGELEGEVLSHTWFHRGPKPFMEDRLDCAGWAVDENTFWSFNGAAAPLARSSGIFVKMFQTALRDVFVEHGASRIRGFIFDSNDQSIMMHEKMGWARLGALSTVALPGLKWIHWNGVGGARHWVVPRSGDFSLSFPPA